MREYKTQMEAAKKGIITPEMQTVAAKEYMEPEKLRELVAKGWVAIPANVNHTSLSAEGVGSGLKTKINVNLGISGDCKDYTMEMQKVDMAIKFGAEAIMDLSNYGKTNTFRKQLIERSPAMIGTVPMYDAIGYLDKDLLEISAEDFLKVVRAHAEDGVDFPRRNKPPCNRGGPPRPAQDEHCIPRRLPAVRVDDDDRQREPVL